MADFPEQPVRSDPAQDARIQREAAMIAKAEADIDAGLGIEIEDLATWFDELDKDENAAVPTPRGTGLTNR